ncbi:MAG: membrane protein insertion efficiency factor YidD [Acidobacteriota bacterium]
MRQCLKRPESYLAAVLLLLVLAGVDATREPSHQFTARAYVGAVEAYQRYLRPASSMIFQCRYRPTCSEYSRQAVARHGIATGLRLTWNRLVSCRSSVALGTLDPVPGAPTK